GLEEQLMGDLVVEGGGNGDLASWIAEEERRRAAAAGLWRVVEAEGVGDLWTLLRPQVGDKFVLCSGVVILVQLVRKLAVAVELRASEAVHERQVLAEDIGHDLHEQIVESLEASPEADGFGERDIGADLEVLCRELPGRVPACAQLIGLRGGQPAR